MRRLLLLTSATSLLFAVACNDATSPPSPAGTKPRTLQHTLVTPSTSPQISAGRLQTCGLSANGTVQCWGGIPDYELAAAVPEGLAGVARVSAGGFHSCALKTDGTISCWGYNDAGQLDVPVGL